MQRTAVLGKGGRVEDDEIVVATCLVEIFKGILAERLVTLVAREIKLDVLGGELDSLGTAVYRVHQRGTASHGIEREAASVAEHIEHTLAS